jgi:hypothetical protein
MCFILILAFKSSVIFIDFTLNGSLFHPQWICSCFSEKTFIDFTLSGSFFFFREFVTFLVNKFILYPSVDFIFHSYEYFKSP